MPQTITCPAGQKKGPFAVSPGAQVTAFTTTGGAGTLTYADEQVLRVTSTFNAWPTAIGSTAFVDIAVKPMQLVMACTSGTMTLLISDPDPRNLLPQTDWMSQAMTPDSYFAGLLESNGWFGDGVNDDSTAVQNSLRTFYAKYPKTNLKFPSGFATSKWTSGITIDPRIMGVIDFNNIHVDFSGAADGSTCITVLSTNTAFNVDMIAQGMRGIKNIWVTGNGEGLAQVFMSIQGANSSGGSAHWFVENFMIDEFGTGISVDGPSAYMNRFVDWGANNVTNVFNLANGANMGENYMLVRPRWGNCSGTNITIASSTGDVYVHGGSIDYWSALYNITSGARLRFIGCHIESNATALYAYGQQAGNTVAVSFESCEFINVAPTAPTYWFNVGSGTMLSFQNCYMYGFASTSGSNRYLCTGTGSVTASGTQFAALPVMSNVLSDNPYNLCVDSTLQNGANGGPIECWLSGATSFSTRMGPIANGSFLAVTSNPNTTNNAIQFFRGGNDFPFMLFPVKGGAMTGFRAYLYAASSFTSGTLTWNLSWRKYPQTGFNTSTNLATSLWTSSFADAAGFLPASTGTEIRSSLGTGSGAIGRAPSWATHLAFLIKGSAMPSSSSVYVEQIEVSQW